MEAFLNSLFSSFGFFVSGAGVLITATLAALIVLLWQWQLSVVALFIVQMSISVISVALYGISPLWAAVQISIVALCCLILMFSVQQAYNSQQLNPAGNWFLRFMALLIIFIGWQFWDIRPPFPKLGPQITDLFIWIGLCSMMLFCLSDTPLLTSVALLMWCIPIHTFLAILLPIPTLVVMIGLLELLIALSTGYLILNNRTSMIVQSYIDTDIYFPTIEELPSATSNRKTLRDRRHTGSRLTDNQSSTASGPPRLPRPEEKI